MVDLSGIGYGTGLLLFGIVVQPGLLHLSAIINKIESRIEATISPAFFLLIIQAILGLALSWLTSPVWFGITLQALVFIGVGTIFSAKIYSINNLGAFGVTCVWLFLGIVSYFLMGMMILMVSVA